MENKQFPIPKHMTIEEASEFWDTHSAADYPSDIVDMEYSPDSKMSIKCYRNLYELTFSQTCEGPLLENLPSKPLNIFDNILGYLNSTDKEMIERIEKWCENLVYNNNISCRQKDQCVAIRQMTKDQGFPKGILCGKYDIAAINTHPFHITGSMMEYYFKSQEDIFKDAITVPLSQISEIILGDHIKYESARFIGFSQPFFVITLIKPHWKKIDRFRSVTLESIIEIIHNIDKYFKAEDIQYTFFLSYSSSFRLIVLLEFDNFSKALKSIEDFKKISCSKCWETVSYFGLSQKHWEAKEDSIPERSLYTILLKINFPLPEHYLESIRNEIKTHIKGHVDFLEITQEGSYWDYALRIEAITTLKEIVSIVTNILITKNKIYRSLTIPRRQIMK